MFLSSLVVEVPSPDIAKLAAGCRFAGEGL
jgi:hypothetical protein